jgi:hypothetical protein
MKSIVQTVIDVLIALGYEATKGQTDPRSNYVQIQFPTYNGGSDYFCEKYKEVIRIIVADRLGEFFYINDKQFIYIKK